MRASATRAVSIDSPAELIAYLERIGRDPHAPGECPAILLALARVARLVDAGCTWMTGRLHIELSALPERTVIDVFVEQGPVRERMIPGVVVDVPIGELERGLVSYAMELLPLRRAQGAGPMVLVAGEDDPHERPTKPVPRYEENIVTGRYKRSS